MPWKEKKRSWFPFVVLYLHQKSPRPRSLIKKKEKKKEEEEGKDGEKGRKWNWKSKKRRERAERDKRSGGITRPYLTLLGHLPQHPRSADVTTREPPNSLENRQKGRGNSSRTVALLLRLLRAAPRQNASRLAAPRRERVVYFGVSKTKRAIPAPWFLKQSKWSLEWIYRRQTTQNLTSCGVSRAQRRISAKDAPPLSFSVNRVVS